MARPLKFVLRRANDTDDPAVCQIAKQSRYTRDFASHRFYRDDIKITYFKGEVGVAEHGGRIVGFVYCKHLKVRPVSVVHFMGVDENARQLGVGRKLMDWALVNQPHPAIELSCEHSNVEGMKFYPAIGYEKLRDGVYGKVFTRPYTRFIKERT